MAEILLREVFKTFDKAYFAKKPSQSDFEYFCEKAKDYAEKVNKAIRENKIEENFKLEFIPIQFSKLIPSLNTNYIDIIIAGMSITEDRKQLVNFSDKYCSSGQGIILNKENDEIKVNDDLIGKTVGVIKGTRVLKIVEGKTDYELLQKINDGLYTIMNNGLYNELIDKHLR